MLFIQSLVAAIGAASLLANGVLAETQLFTIPRFELITLSSISMSFLTFDVKDINDITRSLCSAYWTTAAGPPTKNNTASCVDPNYTWYIIQNSYGWAFNVNHSKPNGYSKRGQSLPMNTTNYQTLTYTSSNASTIYHFEATSTVAPIWLPFYSTTCTNGTSCTASPTNGTFYNNQAPSPSSVKVTSTSSTKVSSTSTKSSKTTTTSSSTKSTKSTPISTNSTNSTQIAVATP